MSSTKSDRRSILLMSTCAALWSIAGIFIKLIPWSPFVIAGMRSIIAFLVIAVFMWKTGRKFRFNRFSILVGVCLASTSLAFVTANKLTTAANAIVLQFTSPVFILVISALWLHQQFHKADIVAVASTLLGISLFFFDKLGAGNLLGNILAIIAGLFMAGVYVITGRSDDSTRMSGILLGQLFTAVIGIPMIFIYPTPVSTTAVLSILILGIVQLGIPYILYAIAAKDCPPLACSLIGAIEPLLNPVWVFLFSGEAPGAHALFGGLIVIASVTGWCVWRDRFIAARKAV